MVLGHLNYDYIRSVSFHRLLGSMTRHKIVSASVVKDFQDPGLCVRAEVAAFEMS